MIVEEQGIDFRTGVRFPSAPLKENYPNTLFYANGVFGIIVKINGRI
nr:MAG TPA: hypothetical protein [Caudoviricetes sp.]